MMDCISYIHLRSNAAKVLHERPVKSSSNNTDEEDVEGMLDNSSIIEDLIYFYAVLRDPFNNLDQIRRDAHGCDCTTGSTKSLAFHLSTRNKIDERQKEKKQGREEERTKEKATTHPAPCTTNGLSPYLSV